MRFLKNSIKVQYLSKREKFLVFVLIATVLELIILNFLIFPLWDNVGKLDENIYAMENSIEDTEILIENFAEKSEKIRELERISIDPRNIVSKMENVEGIFEFSSEGKEIFSKIDVVPISMRIEKGDGLYNVKGRLENYISEKRDENMSLREIYFKTKERSQENLNNRENSVKFSKNMESGKVEKIKKNLIVKESIKPVENRVKSLTDLETELGTLHISENGQNNSQDYNAYSLNISNLVDENPESLGEFKFSENSLDFNYSLRKDDFLSIPINYYGKNIAIPVYISEYSRGNFKLLAHFENTYYEYFPVNEIIPGRINVLEFAIDDNLIVDGIVYETGEKSEEGKMVFGEGVYPD